MREIGVQRLREERQRKERESKKKEGADGTEGQS